MNSSRRKLAFVLASSQHGSLIVNRLDYRMVNSTVGYGVGYEILEHGAYDPDEISLTVRLLDLCRETRGDGVVALDCGANIGVHTIEWARSMATWGSVIGFEAQERIYYALAGNIALNNCFNAAAVFAAVAAGRGSMRVPRPDYLMPGSFGSLELVRRENTEFIGQSIDYENTSEIPMLSIDSLALHRVDFIKIDVEGMELEVLEGAKETLKQSRPILFVETIKVDPGQLRARMEGFGYVQFAVGRNTLAMHRGDRAKILFEQRGGLNQL